MLLAVTPPEGVVEDSLPRLWADSLGGTTGFVVLARQRGPDPALELADGGRLAPLRAACLALGIRVVCSASAGHDGLALEAIRRFGLAGAQLRADPDPDRVARVRELLGDGVLGRSVHGPPPEVPPSPGSIDYTCVAPVFTPRTPPMRGRGPKPSAGLEGLRAWAAHCANVIALGGVEPANAGACFEAGATGIASISTFFGPPARVAENLAALAERVPEVLLDAASQHDGSPTAPR